MDTYAYTIFYEDTWKGIPLISIAVNDAPPTSPVESATLAFYRERMAGSELGAPLLVLSSAEAQITITSAANWQMVVPKIDVDLPIGKYSFRFRTVDGNSDKQTWFTGTLEII